MSNAIQKNAFAIPGQGSPLCAEDFMSSPLPPLIQLPESTVTAPAPLEAQGVSRSDAAPVEPQGPADSSPRQPVSPQRAAMEDPPRQLVRTLHCGDGSESCENCSQITAGVGVGLLGASLGLWAFHCPYEVPFAIAGGVGVGLGACYKLAKESACIPEFGAQWR